MQKNQSYKLQNPECSKSSKIFHISLRVYAQKAATILLNTQCVA